MTFMAINGIETVVYGVDDVALCTRFFEDFGLPLEEKTADEARFRLPEGSHVVLRHVKHPSSPESKLLGTGVHETIWGVDSEASLESLVKSLGRDRDIRRDSDGTAHLLGDDGLALGLRVYRKLPITSAPDPINSPGRANRVNTHRKWKPRARPKTLQHVVFRVPDFEASWAFYRDRLGFRLSDVQRTFGIYARAPGTNDHHNVFFMNAHLPFPGFNGELRFDHANFGVEDLDEVMIGSNHMQRQGWEPSVWGLGRHRISSAVFLYLPCPTGGQAEYGADSDVIDDNWVPRVWSPMFGFFSFVTNMAPFMLEPAAWEVDFVEGYTPPKKAARSPESVR
jgi:catechol 2,3-dioxygenase-like lactoylglutathione lyase family enzyme